ncbi:hypothetical protein ACGFNP_34715 [Nonomuraea sp. NPDC049269]|uniref:hypothetical protein n=1 Tax=Nonomuraea sp. NPDC049269 TaxID=3364349 RepID=UPI00371679AC
MIAYEEVQFVVKPIATRLGGDVDSQQVLAGPLGQHTGQETHQRPDASVERSGTRLQGLGQGLDDVRGRLVGPTG